MLRLEDIKDPEARRREETLRRLCREYRERHGLNGLAEVIRIPGEPSIRERAVKEFAERRAAGIE